MTPECLCQQIKATFNKIMRSLRFLTKENLRFILMKNEGDTDEDKDPFFDTLGVITTKTKFNKTMR